MFPAEFTQKSAGKARGYSNGWACYKESKSWAWASAQANWGGSAPECGKFVTTLNENVDYETLQS